VKLFLREPLAFIRSLFERPMAPSLVLINPWIYDFAAYDLWSKPLGLLYLAGYLRQAGAKVHLIDCLDVYRSTFHDAPANDHPLRRAYGTGKFRREEIDKPEPLKDIPRVYSRYGIPEALFRQDLAGNPRPDAILVTSLMTYWYPGVRRVIDLSREIHPDVPIILGGIYARLCEEHARRFSGADRVVTAGDPRAQDAVREVLQTFGVYLQERPPPDAVRPYPAFDMLPRTEYVCLLTSTGCPYRCRYCASRFLSPRYSRRDPLEVFEEITHWHRRHGVRDFAFYDDALLFEADTHFAILLEHIVKGGLKVRFHTPNALHVREISAEIAVLLYRTGFHTIRLGFETSDMTLHEELDRKISSGEFERAVRNLSKAAFEKKAGAYILAGLPDQPVESVIDTVRHVGAAGVTPCLAEYSPLPHTPMWSKAVRSSSYDIASEPLFHNNTLLPCWDDSQRRRFSELKRLVQTFRQ
jgi:radical SAM superfamily enzyme YgiQ (UPF0313 family)